MFFLRQDDFHKRIFLLSIMDHFSACIYIERGRCFKIQERPSPPSRPLKIKEKCDYLFASPRSSVAPPSAPHSDNSNYRIGINLMPDYFFKRIHR